MINDATHQACRAASFVADPAKLRSDSRGSEPGILADIYRDDINITVWTRVLSANLKEAAAGFLQANPTFQTALTITPQDARSVLVEVLGPAAQTELSEDMAELVEMFCCLFGLQRAGLRITSLDRAMCPKFHVDRVPCRLVTTYRGVATEWLPHETVDRTKLGTGSRGQSDLQSGLFQDRQAIRRLVCGEVALLKGELWEGNENAGLVHRSPAVSTGESRLLLTLDVCR